MKKLYGLFFITIVLLSICGCSSNKQAQTEPKFTAEDEYIVSINQKLVSFSDCANGFSDSLEQISQSTALPTSSQLDSIENKAESLSAVCAQIKEISAPDKYAEAQTALNNSMQGYIDAMTKCKELLDFYREYNAKMRSYSSPEDGGAELKKQCSAIYSEFAVMMRQATSEFQTAQTKFNLK